MPRPRIHNFNPGPSQLPVPVVERAKEALGDFRNTGIGILETSHRSEPFLEMLSELEGLIRRLATIPEDYAILLCPGGATQQFSMVPLNLGESPGVPTIGYLNSGVWSQKALEEAQKFGAGVEVGSSKEVGYRSLPKVMSFSKELKYLHFTSNNTIIGTQFPSEPHLPDGQEFPAGSLICDASSDIFSRPLAIERYALVYAGAQKNIGTAGVTLVIVRRDILATASRRELPLMLDYHTFSEHQSLYNTPPLFAIYILYECMQWLSQNGGLQEMARRAHAKAALLYEVLDSLPIYLPYAEKSSRSLMNVTFQLSRDGTTRDITLEAHFARAATEAGLIGLGGHRLVGGARVSLYNGVTIEDTQEVCRFMRHFAAQ